MMPNNRKIADEGGISHSSSPNLSSSIASVQRIKTLLAQNQLFLKCSGMQTLGHFADAMKNGSCDEVFIQGLFLGPKDQVEKYASTLDETAVYASLFLSASFPLLFSPPDVIQQLISDNPDNHWVIVYYVFLLTSVVSSTICVLIAVMTTVTKNKALRESDSMGFLFLARYHTTISSIALIVGILGFFLTLIPIFYNTLSYALSSALIAFWAFILVTLMIWLNSLRIARHVNGYFMQGTSRADAGRGKQGYVNDPYDPVIGVKLLEEYANLGRLMAARDEKVSGIIEVLPKDKLFNEDVLANLGSLSE